MATAAAAIQAGFVADAGAGELARPSRRGRPGPGRRGGRVRPRPGRVAARRRAWPIGWRAARRCRPTPGSGWREPTGPGRSATLFLFGTAADWPTLAVGWPRRRRTPGSRGRGAGRGRRRTGVRAGPSGPPETCRLLSRPPGSRPCARDWRGAERRSTGPRGEAGATRAPVRDWERFLYAAAAAPARERGVRGRRGDAVGRADRLRRADLAYAHALARAAEGTRIAVRAGHIAERARRRLDGRDWRGPSLTLCGRSNSAAGLRLRLDGRPPTKGRNSSTGLSLDSDSCWSRWTRGRDVPGPCGPRWKPALGKVGRRGGRPAEARSAARAKLWAHVDPPWLGPGEADRRRPRRRPGRVRRAVALCDGTRTRPSPTAAGAWSFSRARPEAMWNWPARRLAREPATAVLRGTLWAGPVHDGQFDAAIMELGEARRPEADPREATWDDTSWPSPTPGLAARTRRSCLSPTPNVHPGGDWEDPGPFEPPATVW